MNVGDAYGEIELGLYQLSQDDLYQVELRVTDPLTEGQIAPTRGRAQISFGRLLELQDSPPDYGKELTDKLFADAAVLADYQTARKSFDIREIIVRFRLLIGASAPKLHRLRWELLLDPETRQPLATSQRIWFSRFMMSNDWRVINLRRKSEIRACVAVAAPTDIAAFRLAPVDKVGEIARAREALTGMSLTTIGEKEPLTVERLIDALRQEIDVLYLVCHGAAPKGQEPCVYLQDSEGKTAFTLVSDLAQRVQELSRLPFVVVLASCESAGKGDAGTVEADGAAQSDANARQTDALKDLDAGFARSDLAGKLAEAGVPAVVAMQGKISMETVKEAMPVFFSELAIDGQLDRALAVARGVVRGRPDSWMPSLFLRLKKGRIWYDPGFADSTESEFERWSAICHFVQDGQAIPIVGPEIGEACFGGTRELSSRLAQRQDFPLESYEQTDLAKVTQYISANQSRRFAQDLVEDQFRQQLLERLNNKSQTDAPLDEILRRVSQDWWSQPDHPFHLLAELPAKMFFNASYDQTLFRVLQASGKTPEVIMTPWRGQEVPKQPQPQNENPSVSKPWVYQIFGGFGKPDALVLTEDDFLDYLITTANLRKLIHPKLFGSLVQSSLLFLGFRLEDWRFRVLFRMIMKTEGLAALHDFAHVGVQVNPDEYSLADVRRAKKFIVDLFKGRDAQPEISIYWGTPTDFLKELQQKLRDTTDVQSRKPAGDGNDWT